jgi:hypothetical protein
MTSTIPHQGVFVVPEARVIAVLDPLLLYEHKLTGDAGVECHEDHSAVACGRDGFVFRLAAVFALTLNLAAATLDVSPSSNTVRARFSRL